MKLSESIRKALIQQINVEFHSAWLYRSISQDMKHRNLPGYAKWLDKQYEEERQHGFKKEDTTMNEVVNEKGVFQLKDLVPYGEEQIINKGLIENDKVRFAVISLAKGSTLPDHAAPRDALLFALDGEAVFTHEGKDYVFKAGDNFAMKKGDRHHIKATTNFKFALLLTEPEA
jgi:quercetin dioxygenase-like cupin family protein